MNLKAEDIKDLIEQHATERAKAIGNRKLYGGKHAILQKVTQEGTPCNKIVNNYYKVIVNTILGYFTGKPIKISHNTSDEIQDELEEIFAINYKDDLFQEVAKDMCITGKGYLLVYQNEEGETKLLRLPAEEVIFVTKTGREDTPELVIRYFYIENREKKKTELYVEVYTDTGVYFYVETEKGELTLDYSRELNPEPHIYGVVPVIEFLNNEEEEGDLEDIKTLVDNYNEIFSYSADENEGVRNYYLAIYGGELDEEAEQDMKTSRIIYLPENSKAEFIAKPANTEPMEKHLNRLEKNIHKISQVPDLTDENFSSNASGVAIKYKLFGLETKCVMKERKMTKGFMQLLKILKPIIKIKTGEEYKLSEFDIQFVRNIPANLTEDISNFVQLSATGKIDDETLLSLLPFISNPLAILEKKEAQDAVDYGIDYPDTHEE